MRRARLGELGILDRADLLGQIAVGLVPVRVDAEGLHVDALLVHGLQAHGDLRGRVEVRPELGAADLEAHQRQRLGHRAVRVHVHGLHALAVDDDLAAAGLGPRGGRGEQVAAHEDEAGEGGGGLEEVTARRHGRASVRRSKCAHYTIARGRSVAMSTHPPLELSHTALSEDEALRFLEGHRIRLGGRTMDPKAQIVGEFVKSIRKPGYYPPLPELRQQLRTMVTLMDEPAPALARIEALHLPGPAGQIPARLYAPRAGGAPLPCVAYFHGGGWVQGDLETHHGLCARLAQHADALVGDPARVAVAGDSAGGNLSAVISQLSAPAVPTCQALIYPAVDFSYDTESHRDMENGHIIPRDRGLWYTEQYLRDDKDKADLRASRLPGQA